eukprot:scaffold74699_cov49-Attheya_sp.AAC.1
MKHSTAIPTRRSRPRSIPFHIAVLCHVFLAIGWNASSDGRNSIIGAAAAAAANHDSRNTAFQTAHSVQTTQRQHPLNTNKNFLKQSYSSRGEGDWDVKNGIVKDDDGSEIIHTQNRVDRLVCQQSQNNDESQAAANKKKMNRRRFVRDPIVASIMMVLIGNYNGKIARAQEVTGVVDDREVILCNDLSGNNGNFECLRDLPPKEPGTVRVFLCRHGQTENNRLGMVQGRRVDPPLNANGRAMAQRIGATLVGPAEKSQKEPSQPLKALTVVHSQLKRAQETALLAHDTFLHNPCHLDPPLVLESRRHEKKDDTTLASLNEVDFGPLAEGQPIQQAKANMSQTYGAWTIGSIDTRPPGGQGESGREILERVALALDELAQIGTTTETILAVSHSTFLRMLLALVMNISLAEAALLEQRNGCINVLDISMTSKHRLPLDQTKLFLPVGMTKPSGNLDIPSTRVVRVNEIRHLTGVSLK